MIDLKGRLIIMKKGDKSVKGMKMNEKQIKIILNKKIISWVSKRINEEWTLTTWAEYFFTHASKDKVSDSFP